MKLAYTKSLKIRLYMPGFLLVGLAVALLKMGVPVSVGAAPEPFKCETAFYQTISDYYTPNSLYKFDPIDKDYDLIGATGNDLTNAAGYNPKDNYIYAATKRDGNSYLSRLDNSGKHEELTRISGADNIVAGTVYYDGQTSVYVYIQPGYVGSVYLDGAKKYQQEVLTLKNFPISLSEIQDIVIVDNVIYGVSGPTGRLVVIENINGQGNVSLKDVTNGRTPFGERLPSGSPYGAGWIANKTEMYFSKNDTGTIYKIKDYTSANPTFEEFSRGKRAQGNDGASCPDARPPDPCQICGTPNCPECPDSKKYNRPFIRVSGGDVRSGADFGGYNGSFCKSTPATRNARIETNGYHNNLNPPADTSAFWGASSGQYGVFSTGTILDKFGDNPQNDTSFFGNDFAQINSMKSLLFATKFSPLEYGTFYGGGEGAPCIDVGGLISDTKEVFSIDDIKKVIGGVNDIDFEPEGGIPEARNRTKVKYQGNVTLSSGDGGITARRSHLIVIDGDLNINTNISYDNADGGKYGTSIEDMPNLTVLVLGNINIASDVKNIDGTYMAYPTEPGKGVINTCTNAPLKLTIDDCNKKLEVTGRLIADSVVWNRTWGTIGEKSDSVFDGDSCLAAAQLDKIAQRAEACASEYINFSPEAYFNNVDVVNFGEVSNVPASTKDLPPVY